MNPAYAVVRRVRKADLSCMEARRLYRRMRVAPSRQMHSVGGRSAGRGYIGVMSLIGGPKGPQQLSPGSGGMDNAVAAVLPAPRKEIETRRWEVAAPGPGEVQLRLEACGV